MISVQTQQILVPKQVYIGDRAEIRCSFTSESPVLKSLTEKGSAELSVQGFSGNLNFLEYEIKEVQLVPSGVNYYNLIVSFVPWRTGSIQLPPFEIKGMETNSADATGESDNALLITFQPENIVSLTEKDSITTIKGFTSPLLLPGTIYKLYGGLIAAVLFLIVAIRLIIKHKAVAAFIKNRCLKRKYNKNRKTTIKALEKLKNQNQKDKTELSDHDVAEQIQKIMRSYLEVRFEYPFMQTVTSQLEGAFSKFQMIINSSEKINASKDIVKVFEKTDLIRYKAGAIFEAEEKNKTITLLINGIEIIEAPDLKAESEESELSKEDENA